MGGIEYRFAEVRAEEKGAVVRGVAMPYGAEADIAGAFRETVEPGAFRFDDVVLNRMHVREDLIARTDGGGLTLTDSATALSLRADVPEYRQDVRDQVARRIPRGLSVEMYVKAEEWPSPDRRVIKAAELRGVALVDRAAYGDTTLQLAKRARDGGLEVRWWPVVV